MVPTTTPGLDLGTIAPPLADEPDFPRDVETILGLEATSRILQTAAALSGLRFVAIARVTPNRWVTCASLDTLDFGLKPGDELAVQTTLCHEVRDCRRPIVIDDVATDPVYSDHHTPARYGFRSYISVPIIDARGRVFGTLCGIDTEPRNIKAPGVVETFTLFADHLAAQLDARAERVLHKRSLRTERSFGRLREEFMAALGHDLRNPVAAVLAGARMIERRDPDPETLELVGHIRASAQRMDKLIGDLLDLAQGRLGGGLPIQRTPELELETEFRSIIAEIRSVADFEITARFDLGPVNCDKARMGQVLSNLLGNAVLHGTPGEPISVEATSADGLFRLSVTNAGPPIPEHARRWIFLPFRRGQADADRQGLGLGLYIASQIARAHDGELTFINGDGQVTFSLTMPC